MIVRSDETEEVFEAKKTKYVAPATSTANAIATSCNHRCLMYPDILGCAARGLPFRFLFLFVHIDPLNAAGFVDDTLK